MAKVEIKDLDARIEVITDLLSKASVGDFKSNIEICHDDIFTQIEMGVNFMLHDLQDEHQKTEQAIKNLEEKLDTIKRQQEAIRELSTPVITIWDGVLTLPVIGVVDSRRTEEMMDTLLNRVVETQAKCVIIDITGVDVVDTKTADHFLKMVKAVGLLGASCYITGISPEIAQTLTNIGVDLSNIKTRRNLQDGLKEAFKGMSLEVKERTK